MDEEKVVVEIEMYKEKISGLEKERRSLNNEFMCLREKYSDLEIKLDILKAKSIEITSEPIEIAKNLICASRELECNMFGIKIYESKEQVYSKSELRQIAEHLLVYCNGAEESE